MLDVRLLDNWLDVRLPVCAHNTAGAELVAFVEDLELRLAFDISALEE